MKYEHESFNKFEKKRKASIIINLFGFITMLVLTYSLLTPNLPETIYVTLSIACSGLISIFFLCDAYEETRELKYYKEIEHFKRFKKRF